MAAALIALALLPGVESSIEKLESDHAAERYEAAMELGKLADPKALPALTDALTDAEGWVRVEAARALVKIGITKKQMPTLVRRLERADPTLGLLLAEALAGLGAEAVPALTKALESDEGRTRAFALTALHLAGRHAAPAVPKLVDLTASKSPAVRRQAGEALRRIGPWAAEQTLELVDRLKYGNEEIQWLSIRVLSGIGPGAKEAVPALRELLAKGSKRVRDAAAQALKGIDVVRKKEPPHPALMDPARAREKAPDTFKVRLETTRGNIEIEVKREWSPRGADRFYNLVKIRYFTDLAVFRVVEFAAQFGVHGDRKVAAVWAEATIGDDPVKVSNKPGWVTFARLGENSRTTQLFFNLTDNSHLDAKGFSPVGRVVKGWDVVTALYSGYGEKVDQQVLFYEGNAYLKREFPNLDYIRRAVLLK